MSMMNLARKQQGASMLEVLIAVLILAIGLLGVASLQLWGLRYNQSAYLRSQATIIAYDMADRMRANPNGVAAGYYNNISSSSLPSDPGCISTGCTPQQLADYDILAWGNYFVANPPMLPGATGAVTKSGNTYTVTVTWTDNEKSGAVTQALSYNFQL
jgi:type IV pilus assembly protein PilV